MSASAIEWTDETWNPVVGCAHVSPGCDRCYAARDAAGRLSGSRVYAGLATKEPGEPAKFTGEVRCLPERLDQPLRWAKPRMVFVNSMSDLFHPDVPDGFIRQVWLTMGLAGAHTFQVLTKRPQRMRALVGEIVEKAVARHAPACVAGPADCIVGRGHRNIWLGTSIESDRYAWRADHLRATPAAVRFLSLEPLLGPVGSLDLADIDWVIVGGESGPGARAMDPGWARDIRDRCMAAGVAFFFKQWGGRTPKAGGRELDGRTWDEMP